MEAIGLVVGVAGLFSACLECLDLVDSARNYEHESEVLIAKLDIQRVRLQIWGDLVGLGSSQNAEDLELLGRQEFGVKRCLEGIRRTLTHSGDSDHEVRPCASGDRARRRLPGHYYCAAKPDRTAATWHLLVSRIRSGLVIAPCAARWPREMGYLRQATLQPLGRGHQRFCRWLARRCACDPASPQAPCRARYTESWGSRTS